MAQVPSNLIPISVTQLPVSLTTSADVLLVGAYQGVTYKFRAGDLLQVAGVPTTRLVIAGTGLTGGGALASNVTLSVAPGGIGTAQLANTGVAPGVYGDGTNVPQLTVDATGRVTAATTVPLSVSGYVPETRQVIAGDGLLGGGALNNNVTLSANYGAATPLALSNSGSAGVALTLSRSDHRHPAVDLAADAQVDGILGLNNGGTARSLVMQPGAVIYSGADGMYVSAAGASGQVLVSGGTAAPTWGSALVVSPQAANVVFAGPTAGSAADPTFRALVNADLPASGVVANTYGSGALVPVLVVNNKGVVTSASTTAVTPAWSNVTGTPTTIAGYGIVDGVTLTGTQILTNKTLTSPVINEILDANGNEILSLSPVASATDYLTVRNGIGVGVPLHIQADGSSSNIGLHIQPKGTGLVTISDGTDFNKGIRFRSSGSAAGAVTLIDAVSSSGHVITLPNANTTLVGRDTTDTLTNKTISGALNTLSSIGNASLTNSSVTFNGVTVALGASGTITAAAPNALTLGAYLTGTSYNGSAAVTAAVDATSTNTASKVVARDSSGNFAAGTITAALSGNATSATNLAGGAASQLPYQTGAGATSFIANGTAGQVLTSAGAGVPAWAGISGGTF